MEKEGRKLKQLTSLPLFHTTSAPDWSYGEHSLGHKYKGVYF